MSRTPYWLLAGLALTACAVPFAEWLYLGAPSLVSLVAAAAFCLMAALLPFLSGRRVQGGHPQRARVCRECHALSWPNDLDLGFCLMCGSTRPRVEGAP